jgi:hypothetical protein
LACIKDIYSLLKKDLSLPELTREPEIIVYDDQSFALSWWPHIIYRQRFDELFNHEAYTLSEEGEYYHQRYIEGEAQQKK